MTLTINDQDKLTAGEEIKYQIPLLTGLARRKEGGKGGIEREKET